MRETKEKWGTIGAEDDMLLSLVLLLLTTLFLLLSPCNWGKKHNTEWLPLLPLGPNPEPAAGNCLKTGIEPLHGQYKYSTYRYWLAFKSAQSGSGIQSLTDEYEYT